MFCRGEVMVLDLKKIFLVENESLSLQTEVDMSEQDEDRVSFVSPAAAEITVCNRAGLVEFSADVRFICKFRCDRCAEIQNRDFACKFRHILVASLSDDSGDDYIEAPDYKLDTDALLRDDILLELPSKFLCKDSCKGLCPKCGKNLNEGDCGCSLQEADPRLAILRQLLTDE